jgi:hypothetical protein
MNHDLVNSSQSSSFLISETNKGSELSVLLSSFPVSNSLIQYAALDALNSSLLIIAIKVYIRCRHRMSETAKAARIGSSSS